MRIIIILALFLLFYSCSGLKQTAIEHNSSSFLIKKIKSKNDWYIIYATKNDSLFKIISKKESCNNRECKKIIVGRYYDFVLHSRKKEAIEINGVRIQPMNYLDVHCYSYDKETTICIEPKKGIYDLY